MSLDVPEFGEDRPFTGLTKSVPRSWTEKEVDWVTEQKANGLSVEEIAEALQRTPISVQVKLKRMSKDSDNYNTRYRELKYHANQSFLSLINPKSVLDVYAGHSWYQDRVQNLVTNDPDPKFETTFSLDAHHLLAQLFIERQKFDLIDLDPYGSSYDCFDLAIKMARKGIVVSFGEYGHLRWRRLDFVRDRYQIQELSEFRQEKFTEEVQRIGRINKKKLTLVDSLQYENFYRAYFEIEQLKITEQWEGKND